MGFVRRGMTGAVLAVSLALATMGGLDRAARAEVTSANSAEVSAYLLQRGVGSLRAARVSEAVDYLEQAVVAHPKNARAFAYLGQSHEQAGRKERARKYYETALSIDPDDLKALQWAGEAALADEDLEAARAHRDRLRRLCAGRCAEYRSLNKAITTSNP